MIKVREFTTEIKSISLSAIQENNIPEGKEKVALINEVISDEQAKEVVKDRFWIVERSGNKIGTLRHKAGLFKFYENLGLSSFIFY